MQALFNGQSGKDWIYFITRLIILATFSVLIYLIVPRNINGFNSVQDIAIPAIVGFVGALIVLVMSYIKPVRSYTPFAVLLADWALAGVYVYYAANNNQVLLVGICGAILVSGMLRV